MKNKIKYVVVDDDEESIKAVRLECMEFDFMENVGEYTDPKEFLKKFNDLDFDVCFLDHEMPEITGTEIAKELHDKNIIFITGKELSAKEIFDLNVIDFISKPIRFSRFNKAINKLKKQLNKKKENVDNEIARIFLNTDVGKTLFRIDHMRYISTHKELDSRDKLLINVDGSYHILKNIKIEDFNFFSDKNKWIQINKSTLVHIDAIDRIQSTDYIILKYEEPILNNESNNRRRKIGCTIGHKYKEEFNKKTRHYNK